MNKGLLTICGILTVLQDESFFTDNLRKVVSFFTAESAVCKAYRKGRRDIIKNIPELNWIDGGEWSDTGVEEKLICHADTPWERYLIVYRSRTQDYELICIADTLKVSKSVSELKFIGKKDYKRRVHETLGLINKNKQIYKNFIK